VVRPLGKNLNGGKFIKKKIIPKVCGSPTQFKEQCKTGKEKGKDKFRINLAAGSKRKTGDLVWGPRKGDKRVKTMAAGGGHTD